MTEMTDVLKKAQEATQALYTLQQDYAKVGGLAEDTKKNLETHLSRCMGRVEMATRAAREAVHLRSAS